MPKNIKKFVLLYLICIFTSTTTFAKNVVVKENNNGSNNNTKTKQTKLFDNISFSLSTGITGIREDEYVYHLNDGHWDKASHLLWKMNIPTISGGVNFDINKYFSFGFKASKVFLKDMLSAGVVDDWDWDDDYIVLTHHSRGRISVEDYYNIDVNIDLSLLLYKNFKLKGIVGYKHSFFDFIDDAGTTEFWYPEDGGGHFFSDEPGLHYRQTYKVPYIGLKGIYNYNKWELTAVFNYSNKGKANNMDHHIVTETIYKYNHKKIKFYSLQIIVGYYIKNNIKLFIDAEYNNYKKVIADTGTINGIDMTGIGQGDGMANRNWSAKIGVEMKVR